MDYGDRYEASRTDDGRYRLLVDAISDYAIYMLDSTGRVTSWNPGAERFKGYKADEIIGRHFSCFYTAQDQADGLPELALKTARDEGRFEREGWRIRKDGGHFWAHVVIDPIRTPEGGLIGFAKITRDLTERKRADAALQNSEEQFRRLVQGVTDYAIYMLDRDGLVANWNAGAERIKGYRPDEIVGRHFSCFYTEEDRAAGAPAQGLETALREGRWEREGIRVRKDGSRFWANVVIDPIRDDLGEVIGFAKVTRDVTERKQAQQALDHAREALFQSQKMDAIGQLTGGVAHDFNNLLMAILGSLELVRKRLPFDPKITPLLDNAIQGAERGATLTQRMLAFARKQELKAEVIDLPTLINGVLGLLERVIGPGIRIETRFAPNLPFAQSDPTQLETALLNLVVNARDAMPEGGVIAIGAAAETVTDDQSGMLPGSYVRLSVADTGEGMDEATLSKATEPFFTTKGIGKGTGLGLSMVHGLAAQSGGRLTIDSDKRRGTTVELWLPAAGPDEAVASAAASAPADAAAPTRRLRILAVDDDLLVLRNTSALLEDLGHEVISASSPAEAIGVLAGPVGFDLMITDQAMPEMSGLQLREVVRRTHPELPVLIATGYAELPAGVCPELPRIAKPFKQGELAAAVLQTMRETSEPTRA